MILIVDDHHDTGHLLVRLLQRCGHEAIAVAGGPAALAWLRDNPTPQLVVLDRHMPDMDGFQVLREIRDGAAAAGVPVLFYSAYCDADGIREALQLGAQAYLVKGVTPLDEVCATVARHLGAAHTPPPVAADDAAAAQRPTAG
jgi:CheY-like chemotaxis protein